MEFIRTEIPEVVLVRPRVFRDARGYFFESYNKKVFDEALGPLEFVQDNQSRSVYGVVRGLHYQKGEASQAKLVHVISGTVLDVAVDLRRGSPTFGRHVAVELSAESGLMLFIPRGFAHGFSVLSEEAVFQYKCDNPYNPAAEGAVAWDDPALGIDWRIPREAVILSEKDRRHPRLADVTDLFDY